MLMTEKAILGYDDIKLFNDQEGSKDRYNGRDTGEPIGQVRLLSTAKRYHHESKDENRVPASFIGQDTFDMSHRPSSFIACHDCQARYTSSNAIMHLSRTPHNPGTPRSPVSQISVGQTGRQNLTHPGRTCLAFSFIKTGNFPAP